MYCILTDFWEHISEPLTEKEYINDYEINTNSSLYISKQFLSQAYAGDWNSCLQKDI